MRGAATNTKIMLKSIRYSLLYWCMVTTSGLSSVYGSTASRVTKYDQLVIPLDQPKKKRMDVPTRMTHSAMDAAVAINSIEFISHLTSYKMKDITDIKSWTQLVTASSCQHTTYSISNRNVSELGISAWISGIKSPGCGDRTIHETVIEYLAQLWFLPYKKDGFRFRETIRVISISTDGQTATVECTAQYHNGSRWVDCSRVVCTLISKSLDDVANNVWGYKRKGERSSVKMSFDGELLVWLPKPVSKAVKRTIISAFETAVLDFFHGLVSH